MEDPTPAVNNLLEEKTEQSEPIVENIKPAETNEPLEVNKDEAKLTDPATDSAASLNTYTTTKASIENGNDAEADSSSADQSQASTASSSGAENAKTTLNESNDEYKSIDESLNQNTSSSSAADSSSSVGKKLTNDNSLGDDDDDDDAYEDLDEYNDDEDENYVDVQEGTARKPLSAYAAFNGDFNEDDDEPINGDEFKLDPEFEKLSLSPPPGPATASGATAGAVSTSTTRLSEKLRVDSSLVGTVKKGQFYGHDDSRGEQKEPSVESEAKPDAAVTTENKETNAEAVGKLSPERWSHDKYNPALLNTSEAAKEEGSTNGRKSQRANQRRNANNNSPPKQAKNGRSHGSGKTKGISLSEYLEQTDQAPAQASTDTILNSTAISNVNTSAVAVGGVKPQKNNHLNNVKNGFNNGRRSSNENSSSSSSTVTGSDRNRGGANGNRRNAPRRYNNNVGEYGVGFGNGLPADLKKRLDFRTKKRAYLIKLVCDKSTLMQSYFSWNFKIKQTQVFFVMMG
jgi:hypothetical protein